MVNFVKLLYMEATDSQEHQKMFFETHTLTHTFLLEETLLVPYIKTFFTAKGLCLPPVVPKPNQLKTAFHYPL